LEEDCWLDYLVKLMMGASNIVLAGMCEKEGRRLLGGKSHKQGEAENRELRGDGWHSWLPKDDA
jgi:hypothetical protein